MPSSKTTLDELSDTIKQNVNPSFWKGLGNRVSFRKEIKKLVAEDKISKIDYNYFLKNERRILMKTELIHLIPELQSKEVLEQTFKHLYTAVVEKNNVERETQRESCERKLVESLENHLEDTLNPKKGSLKEGFDYLLELIEESQDLFKDLMKISKYLADIRDDLLEKGQSRRYLYEIEKVSSKLANIARNPNPIDIPSKEELAESIMGLRMMSDFTNVDSQD